MQTRTIITLGTLVLLTALLPGVPAASGGSVEGKSSTPSFLADYRFWRADERTRLPKYLREVSGLAEVKEGVVALHHDNSALTWTFNYRSAQLSEAPIVTNEGRADDRRGDYEGVAMFGQQLLLTTSSADMLLFDSPTLGSPASSAPTQIDTQFRRHCNFEGLAIVGLEQKAPVALLPCKYPRFEDHGGAPALDHLVYLFRHPLSPAAKPLEPLTIDVTQVLRQYRKKRLRPSAVEVVGDRLLVLAGKERVLLETTLQGELIAWRRLAWPRHRQAEGLTVGSDGSIVIADEGRWLGGTVTVYHRQTP